MENNESNPKPQQTGGLKLMTVFIAVLALHVVVIGGITIYYMVNGGSTDSDLVTDKTHKSVKVASEGAAPDAGTSDSSAPAPDKSAAGTTTVAETSNVSETSNVPMTIPAPESSTPAPSTAAANANAPAPAPDAANSPAPVTPSAEPTTSVPSGPIASGTTPSAPPAVSTPPSAPPDASSEMAGGPESEAVAPSASAGGMPYTVKAHDSLARIAHRHHVTVAELKAANSLTSDRLQIGQKLTIPEKAPAGPSATTNVAAADSSSAPASAPASSPAKPAKKTHKATSLASLRDPDAPLLGDSDWSAYNSAKKTHKSAHSSTASTTGSHHVYTVVKGDTLSKIAHKFRVSPSALMAANNLGDSHKMKVGQKLRIPSQESRSANDDPAPVAAPASVRAQAVQPDEQIEPRATPSGQLANFPSSL